MILGLSGYARAGKNSVADLLGVTYMQRAFADPMRDALLKLNPWIDSKECLADAVDHLGWDQAKVIFPEIRRLLQVLGTEVGREMIGQSVWVDIALKCVKPNDNIVFTDVRFHNEANAIKFLGGQIWRVERPQVGAVNAHPSETAMDDWPFDQIIYNDESLEELKVQVGRILHMAGVGV